MGSTPFSVTLFRFFVLAARGRLLFAHAETRESVEQAGWVDLQGPLEMFDRLGQLALLSERVAPVVVSVGVFRLDVQGLLVMIDRLGRLALLSERQAQVVVDFGVFRPDLQGLLVMFD